MYHTNRNRRHSLCKPLVRCLLLLAVLWLPAACITDDEAAAAGEGTYNVRLLIDPQLTATRAEDGTVSAIRQLRVYVFNEAGTRVGYYEDMSLSATGQAYYIPFRLQEGGNLTFYVVANEGGVTTAESLADLTEETPLDDLRNHRFETDAIDRDRGDLMTGETPKEITAQGDDVDVVTIQLVRPFSLLNVFFAKSEGFMQTEQVTVTSVKLCDYAGYGLFKDRSTDDNYEPRSEKEEDSGELLSDESYPDGLTLGDESIVPVDEQKTNHAGYGEAVITKPVTLDKDGNSVWTTEWVNADGTTAGEAPRLVIEYTVGTEPKTATVYLPPIASTNYKYNVKCLIIKKAVNVGVTFQWRVVPWTGEEIDVPEFS